MSGLLDWRGFPRRKEPALLEPTHKFLEVSKTYSEFGVDYYDADVFSPFHPDPTTLQIVRSGQRSPVTVYGPGGWTRYRWVMKAPSTIRLLRADRTS